MTTKEVLQKAREYITPREKWTIGMRHTMSGARCAIGAVEIGGGTDMGKEIDLLASLVNIDECPPDPCNPGFSMTPVCKVARYNNTHSHECVLEWFDRAIEAAA